MSRLMLSVLLCLVTVSFLGCAEPGGEPADRLGRVPATATVNYNGEAVAGAMVTLLPVDEEDGKPAAGKTDSSGKATLFTYQPGDGAVPGDYTVTVSKTDAPAATGGADEGEERDEPEEDENAPTPEPKDLLPAKYKDREQTDLKATIKEGDPNDLVFELTD